MAAASLPGTLFPSLPSPPAGPPRPASTGTPSANGSLVVTPDRLDLGRRTTGQLTLTAVGGAVSWTADTSSTLVTLSSQLGTLQAGQSVTLVVSVTPGSGDALVFVDSSPATGAATLALSADPAASQAVEVTWTTPRPRSPRPSSSPRTRAAHPRPRPSSVPVPVAVAVLLLTEQRGTQQPRPRLLSWTGDLAAPFAYRPGPPGPPDRA